MVIQLRLMMVSCYFNGMRVCHFGYPCYFPYFLKGLLFFCQYFRFFRFVNEPIVLPFDRSLIISLTMLSGKSHDTDSCLQSCNKSVSSFPRHWCEIILQCQFTLFRCISWSIQCLKYVRHMQQECRFLLYFETPDAAN